jgi:competence protein ComEA
MLKKLLLVVGALITSIGFAFANVDVNQADQAALDGIKGIGPTTSKAILEERKKGGNFKDWNDLQTRVKGVGDKSSDKFSEAGLTVNGKAKPGVSKTDVAKTEKSTVAAKDKAPEVKKPAKP